MSELICEIHLKKLIIKLGSLFSKREITFVYF